ncbi:hypothetical protein EG329_005675 [Mollisiaceae sp. DMI_Dod_QoI]|nr:hypothetical protein EG329_005675 [Helotiales sp. DMI_Dod_QoI]
MSQYSARSIPREREQPNIPHNHHTAIHQSTLSSASLEEELTRGTAIHNTEINTDPERDLSLINWMLPIVDLEALQQNTTLALYSGEIAQILIQPLHQFFHNITRHWEYPLRRQDIHEAHLPLFRWLLLSYTNINTWNRFVADVKSQYLHPAATARERGFFRDAPIIDILESGDDLRYFEQILTQNMIFEQDGGPLTIFERDNSHRTFTIRKSNGMSNFTVAKQGMMRTCPRELKRQIAEALETFGRNLQERNHDIQELIRHERELGERILRSPRAGSLASDSKSSQLAPNQMTSEAPGITELENPQASGLAPAIECNLDEKIVQVSETIKRATELLQALVATKQTQEHNARLQLHSQHDNTETDRLTHTARAQTDIGIGDGTTIVQEQDNSAETSGHDHEADACEATQEDIRRSHTLLERFQAQYSTTPSSSRGKAPQGHNHSDRSESCSSSIPYDPQTENGNIPDHVPSDSDDDRGRSSTPRTLIHTEEAEF